MLPLLLLSQAGVAGPKGGDIKWSLNVIPDTAEAGAFDRRTPTLSLFLHLSHSFSLCCCSLSLSLSLSLPPSHRPVLCVLLRPGFDCRIPATVDLEKFKAQVWFAPLCCLLLASCMLPARAALTPSAHYFPCVASMLGLSLHVAVRPVPRSLCVTAPSSLPSLLSLHAFVCRGAA
jgi:hypothetical protein